MNMSNEGLTGFERFKRTCADMGIVRDGDRALTDMVFDALNAKLGRNSPGLVHKKRKCGPLRSLEDLRQGRTSQMSKAHAREVGAVLLNWEFKENRPSGPGAGEAGGLLGERQKEFVQRRDNIERVNRYLADWVDYMNGRAPYPVPPWVDAAPGASDLVLSASEVAPSLAGTEPLAAPAPIPREPAD